MVWAADLAAQTKYSDRARLASPLELFFNGMGRSGSRSRSPARRRSRSRDRSGSRSPKRRSPPRRRSRSSSRSPPRHRGGGRDNPFTRNAGVDVDRCKIFIGGLSTNTDDRELRDIFEKYGKITDLFMPQDPSTRQPRGFAFITFSDDRDADDAVAAWDGYCPPHRLCMPVVRRCSIALSFVVAAAKSKGGKFRSISRARGRRLGVMVVVATATAAGAGERRMASCASTLPKGVALAARRAGFRTMTAGAIVTADVGGRAQHLEIVIAIGTAATETWRGRHDLTLVHKRSRSSRPAWCVLG